MAHARFIIVIINHSMLGYIFSSDNTERGHGEYGGSIYVGKRRLHYAFPVRSNLLYGGTLHKLLSN